MSEILKRKRALLDNSALRLLALSDPSTQRTNEALRESGTRPLISVFTATEILKGLVKRPKDEELRARCAYLLRLEGLSLLPEKDECVLIEFDRQHGVTEYFTHTRSTIETLRVLQECAEEGLSPALVALGETHYASVSEDHEAGLDYVRSNPTMDRIRAMSFAQLLDAKVEDMAAQLLHGCLARAQETYSEERFAATVENAATNNGLAPTLAGQARVHLWVNWQVAQKGDVGRGFREDLKVLAYALNADAVVTNDDEYFVHGPLIFPEIRFVRTTELLPGL